MATTFQTPMDPLLNQGFDGGDEDPNHNGGGGKGKMTRGHVVEGNTNHSIKIADAVAAFMKAHVSVPCSCFFLQASLTSWLPSDHLQGKKGKGGQKLTFSGVTKGSGMPYKTSSKHRVHSKK